MLPSRPFSWPPPPPAGRQCAAPQRFAAPCREPALVHGPPPMPKHRAGMRPKDPARLGGHLGGARLSFYAEAAPSRQAGMWEGRGLATAGLGGMRGTGLLPAAALARHGRPACGGGSREAPGLAVTWKHGGGRPGHLRAGLLLAPSWCALGPPGAPWGTASAADARPAQLERQGRRARRGRPVTERGRRTTGRRSISAAARACAVPLAPDRLWTAGSGRGYRESRPLPAVSSGRTAPWRRGCSRRRAAASMPWQGAER